MRAGTLLGVDLEFGTPELLDLEAVSMLAGVSSGDPQEAEPDIGLAEVYPGRQAERKIEAAQLAGLHLALGKFVAPGALRLVGDPAQALGQGLEIAAEGVDPAADPALDPDLFARAVHAAVIEDVPGVGVVGRVVFPGALRAPPRGGLRQEGGVVAAGGGDGARGVLVQQFAEYGLGIYRLGEVEAHQPVLVGASRQAMRIDLDLYSLEAGSIEERIGPDQELAAVGEGVDGDPSTLDPGDDLDASFFRLLERADDEDYLVAQLIENGAQIDGRFGQLIGSSPGLDPGREELLPRRDAFGFPVAGVPKVLVVGVPIGGFYLVGIDQDRFVVDRVDADARGTGRGGYHQAAGIGEETLRRRAEGKRERDLFAELLGEGVFQCRVKDDGIGRAGTGAAADMKLGAVDVDLHILELRLDLDLGGLEELRVDRVVEVDHHWLPRGTVFLLVLVPIAPVLRDLEGRVGVEGEGLCLRRLQGPLERGEVLFSLDGYLAGGGEPVGRAEGHPPVRGSGSEDILHPRIGGELGFAHHAEGVFFATGLDRDVFEDSSGIDSLVEDQDHDGVEPPGASLRPGGDDGGRRGAEGPGDLLFQLHAGSAFRLPGDLDLVDGGHREPGLPLFTLRFKEQGLCSDPSPASLDRRGEYYGQLAGGEGVVGVEGHHRLGEGHAEMGCQRQASLRLEAQHLELLVGGDLDGFYCFRWRKSLPDRRSCPRRRQG